MPNNIQPVKIFEPRRAKIKFGLFDMNYIQKRPLWISAWWSAALPGLGHIHLGHYIKGLLLMSGEIALNTLAELNLAIYYSMIGNFDGVHEVINYNWLCLYCCVFAFAIWDAYRITIDQNQSSLIEAKQEERSIAHGTIGTWGVNTLKRRNPRMAFVWSLLFAGLFHICNNKLISGITLMGWMIAISYYTKFPTMIIYTMTGQLDLIPPLINQQWLLFFPSIYLFSIFDGYVHAVYSNELFVEEQSYYLNKSYGVNELILE